MFKHSIQRMSQHSIVNSFFNRGLHIVTKKSLFNSDNHLSSILIYGGNDARKGEIEYKKRSINNDLWDALLPFKDREVLVLCAQTTCFFPIPNFKNRYQVFSGHASGFLTHLRNPADLLHPSLIISKVGGQPLATKGTAIVGRMHLEEQNETATAVYEDQTNYNILRGHGFQRVHKCIIPEYILAFDVERCEINTKKIRRNFEQAKQSRIYTKIGNSCSEFLYDTIAGVTSYEAFNNECQVPGMSTQRALRLSGFSIIDELYDHVLERQYRKYLDECGLTLDPVSMGQQSKKLPFIIDQQISGEELAYHTQLTTLGGQ